MVENIQGRGTKALSSAPASSTDQQSHTINKICLPSNKFPRWIGQKFDPEGKILPFPGSTIICHLPLESPIYRVLLDLHDEMKTQAFSSLYVLLPPLSWHMTVFEGVSDQIRKPGVWPAGLPLDAPLSQCTALFQEKLREFDVESGHRFKMAIDGFEPLEDGIALKVIAAGPTEENKIRQLRDRLSEHLQVRHPDHGIYSFHVSMSYMLRFLSEQDNQMITNFLQGWRAKLPDTFELGAAEFCIFDDMFAFDRQFFLRSQS